MGFPINCEDLLLQQQQWHHCWTLLLLAYCNLNPALLLLCSWFLSHPCPLLLAPTLHLILASPLVPVLMSCS